MKRVVIILCLSILVPLLGIEFLLTIADPFGFIYYDDLAAFYSRADDSTIGYTMHEGAYTLSHWGYTIDANGYRHVPDRNPDGTTIYFLGDSVTFAWGVEDGKTWVNLLAREFGLNAVNVGHPGYNIGNLRRLRETLPDDVCVVYLTTRNDIAGDLKTLSRDHWNVSRLSRLYYTLQAVNIPPQPAETFAEDMAAITAYPRTLVLTPRDGFEGYFTPFGAVVVEPYTQWISYSDGHATVAGNIEIADAVRDAVSVFVHKCEQ